MCRLKVRFIIRTTGNQSFAGMIDVESLMEHLRKVKAKDKREKNKSLPFKKPRNNSKT
jgi:hypothetical protein